MGWISRAIVRSIKRAEREIRDEREENEITCSSSRPLREADLDEYGQPLNINIVSVRGGRIVRFSHYDRKTDRSDQTTYIISDEEEFTESLTKLIVMETMKL